MNIDLTRNNKTQASVVISIDEIDYIQVFEKNLRNHSKSIKIKGFREGSIPIGVLKKRYGKPILLNTLKGIAESSIKDYLIDHNIKIFDKPMVTSTNLDSFTNSDFENPSGNIFFNYNIYVPSDFNFSINKNITLPKYTIDKIDDDYLEMIVDRLRRINGKITKVEKSNINSVLYGTLIFKNIDFSTNTDIYIKYIKENKKDIFTGLSKDSQIEFNPKQVFIDNRWPINIPEALIQKMNSTEGNFIFKIEEISEIEPHDLNNELFNKIYNTDNKKIKTKDDFLLKLNNEILSSKKAISELILNYEIKKILSEKVHMDLPEDIIAHKIELKSHPNQEYDKEKALAKHIEQIKIGLIIDDIAYKNDLQKLSENDLLIAFKSWAPSVLQKQKENMNDELIKNLMFKFLESLEEEERIKFIHHTKVEKILNFVKGSITIENKTVSARELDDIYQNTHRTI